MPIDYHWSDDGDPSEWANRVREIAERMAKRGNDQDATTLIVVAGILDEIGWKQDAEEEEETS
jgi:hypothetical protein